MITVPMPSGVEHRDGVRVQLSARYNDHRSDAFGR